MAHRKMILTQAGAQLYRTRMLKAGDPVTLGAGDARLFEKQGWAEEPKRDRKVEPIIPTVEEVLAAEVVQPEVPKPEPVRQAPAKKPVARKTASKRKGAARKRNA